MDRPAFTLADLTAASPAMRYDAASPSDRGRFLIDLHTAANAPRDGTFDLLALSGGGANGAYGAGVLVGWGERGDRPEFEVITGVSIGALMAPFAFVGEEGDADLRAAFTDGRASRILEPRWVMAMFGPGIFRAGPLRTLVAKSVDDRLMVAVAKGHRQGRRLYVATTSLDTRHQVIWDMGALAASGHPQTRDRFIDILTASASVPGAFPPVLIDLENEGRSVRELHSDGRTTANFFIAPEGLLIENASIRPAHQGAAVPGRIWIIVNGTPEEHFSVASFDGVAAATRALDALLNASTRMSMTAATQFARLNGFALHATTAGDQGHGSSLNFDQERMRTMFDQGRQMAAEGRQWTAAVVSAPFTSD